MSLETAKACIVALAILHNIAIQEMDEDWDEDEGYEGEGEAAEGDGEAGEDGIYK